MTSNRGKASLRKAFTLQNIRDSWGETCESLRSPQRKVEFSPETVRRLLARDELTDWGANHERVDAEFEAQMLAESLFPPIKPMHLMDYGTMVRKMHNARPELAIDKNKGDAVVKYLVQRRIKRVMGDESAIRELEDDQNRLLSESKQYWKANPTGG